MNKKLLVSLLSLLLIGMCLTAPASAEVKASLVALPANDQTEYKAGDLLQLQLYAQDALDLFGLQFVLHYDPSLLQVASDAGSGAAYQFDSSLVSQAFQMDSNAGMIVAALRKKEIKPVYAEKMPIGSIQFKALKPGTTSIKLEQIKIVNSIPRQIQASSQYEVELTVLPVVSTGISLNKAELWLDLAENSTESLKATVSPDHAANKPINWTSKDPSVASVDQSGKVAAVGTGVTTIVATTVDSGLSAESIVKVGTIVTLAWHEGVFAGGAIPSFMELRAVHQENGSIVGPELTNAEGKAMFTELTPGRWKFEFHKPEEWLHESGVLQASASYVEIDRHSLTPAAWLKVIPLEISHSEPFDIAKVVRMLPGIVTYSWDFDLNGVSDRQDAQYLLQMIGPKHVAGGLLR